MPRSADQLRDDALAIWRTGVAGVRPERLIPEFVRVDGRTLWVGDEGLALDAIRRMAVVGGGKGAGAMAAALEQALGIEVLRAHDAAGLVNVPVGGDAPSICIRQHVARPLGVNEPTEAAAAGAREMLELVASLGPDDLCFCLLTGGGSALMPAPIEGLSLADKVTLTRELSARGATIYDMNAVRRELSLIKGGGLARACRAGRLVALILSDVPGDDLATIASGPTVVGPRSTDKALRVLRELKLDELPVGRQAIELIVGGAAESTRVAGVESASPQHEPVGSGGGEDADARHTRQRRVTNLVIGNNATAVDAAGVEAERRGYSHAMISAREPEGLVEDVARGLVDIARRMRGMAGPDCLISGGEPTVRLAPEGKRGLGGRNQQLCLAALAALDDWRGLALVSGGVDGEDGPTDAAGAWVDERVAQEAKRASLDVRDFLERNDAYRFFERAGGLLKTGPTNTNVGDLRVLTVSRADSLSPTTSGRLGAS